MAVVIKFLHCLAAFFILQTIECSKIQEANDEDAELACRDGDLRVSEGTPQDGYIEYCVDGVWGVVCGDNFDNHDATVACTQLGYKTSLYPAQTIYIMKPDETIMHLAFIQCDGSEAQLSQCPYPKHKGPTDGTVYEGKDYCAWKPFTRGTYLYELAKIHCSEDLLDPPEDDCHEYGKLRIAKGGDIEDGFLEYCINGKWGAVCGDNWDNKDAEVACRQLGYQATEAPAETAYVPRIDATPMFLSYINCVGDEAELPECPLLNGQTSTSGIVHDGKDYCHWSNQTEGLWNYGLAKIHCNEKPVDALKAASCPADEEGQIKLINGNSPLNGRVEICIDGLRGTICDQRWGRREAVVVCRQLGHSIFRVTAVKGGFFGSGYGPIHGIRYSCDGTEENLMDCEHIEDVNLERCNHELDDAAVICKPAEDE